MKKAKNRILVIDIGNRSVKIYIATGDELGGKWLFGRIVANWEQKLSEIAERSRCKEAVIISVVPQDTQKILTILDYAEVRTLVVDGTMKLPISLDYASPKYLGADRIADAVGAFRFWNENSAEILVVDAGTAITIDLLRDKKFLGGTIIPGIDMMEHSLHSGTAQLPRPKEKIQPNFPGKGTEQCIVSGAISAAAGGIRYVWEKVIKNPDDALLLLTGGDAERISQFLKIPHKIDPLLLIRGAIAIYDFTNKNGAE